MGKIDIINDKRHMTKWTFDALDGSGAVTKNKSSENFGLRIQSDNSNTK